ncbi:MAG: hypothetical protein AABY15_00225 [Nanoarchaeota archaeon]
MTQKRNKEFFEKFLHDCSEEETSDVVEFDMGYVPFTIERISDGKILQLNTNNESYSFTHSISLNPSEYSWGRLFRDNRCTDAFRPLGWVKIDNLETMHKAFKK